METQKEFINFFLWCCTVCLLSVFCIISAFIYLRGKKVLFFYYALYCFLVLLYLSTKLSPSYLSDLTSIPPWDAVNWVVQIFFYVVYYLFGIAFLGIKQPFPRFTKLVNIYLYSITSITLLLLIIEIAFNKDYVKYFYGLVFVPSHILMAVAIMYHAIKLKKSLNNYFIVGSIIYIAFAVTAYTKTVQADFDGLLNPVTWFYIGIIFESAIFSYALGMMIWSVYKQQQTTALKLNDALAVIEKKVEEEKILRTKEKEFLEAEVLQQQLNTKVAFLQNKILLEQINAHFIFNVLNAIKVFVAENKTQKAVQYLNKFAKFIRNVLDGSRSNQILLSEEIKNMETYLSIEKMRFEGRFQYVFDIASSLNTQDYTIPTFLLQPFIENALWHGIMPLQTDGLIVIKVYTSSGKLFIEIDDNGVGIHHAKKEKHHLHKSVGMLLVQEIVEHHKMTGDNNISIAVEDKMEKTGLSGTLVQIQITYPS